MICFEKNGRKIYYNQGNGTAPSKRPLKEKNRKLNPNHPQTLNLFLEHEGGTGDSPENGQQRNRGPGAGILQVGVLLVVVVVVVGGLLGVGVRGDGDGIAVRVGRGDGRALGGRLLILLRGGGGV